MNMVLTTAMYTLGIKTAMTQYSFWSE
jgi:hypothetical protein